MRLACELITAATELYNGRENESRRVVDPFAVSPAHRLGKHAVIKLTGVQTADSAMLTLRHLNRASAFAMYTNLITPMAALERFAMFDE